MVFFDHLSSGFSLLSLYTLLFLNMFQKKGSFGPMSKLVLTLEKTLSDLSGLKEPPISRLFYSAFFELSAGYLTFLKTSQKFF